MDIKRLPKTEFAAAVAQIAGERDIDPQEILDAIETGLVSAYRRDQKEHGIIIPDDEVFEVELTPSSGSFSIFKVEGKSRTDVTPPGFGRIAAMTAKQVIDQKIREAERDKVVGEYQRKVGSLVAGVVLHLDSYKMSVGIGKTEGICPTDEQIRGENLGLGSKKLFLIRSIETDDLGRKNIILSRRHSDFIKELFAREVPEVGNRTVVIERVARSSGERTKIAVSSGQPGVDPVGSCIGQKGARIQAVLNELPSSEKVDVVAFSKSLNQLVINSLSPAEGARVISIKDGQAVVEVPESQLALAIGSGGENVRLAGVLCGLDIKVQAAK